MWGWEGLYGRPRGGEVAVFSQDSSQMNRTRATIKALPTALAPTDVDGLGLRVMPLGRSSRSPWLVC